MEELTLRLILDPEAEVVESAFTGLLPGFLAWAKAGDKLMAKLLPSVLARALSTVQVRRTLGPWQPENSRRSRLEVTTESTWNQGRCR